MSLGRIGCLLLLLAGFTIARPDASWLVRPAGSVSMPMSVDVSCRVPLRFQVDPQPASTQDDAVPTTSGWKRAGVYALEFGGAAVATFPAAWYAGSMLAYSWADEEGSVCVGLASFPFYTVASALLSAAGTHLVARGLGRGGSFTHALVGGAIGGLAGSASALLITLISPPGDGSGAFVPVALILTPACAVAIYNALGK